MRLKKINLFFIVILLSLTVACIVHVTISYINVSNAEISTVPPTIAFLLIIPYAFFMLIVAISWLIVVRKHKKTQS